MGRVGTPANFRVPSLRLGMAIATVVASIGKCSAVAFSRHGAAAVPFAGARSIILGGKLSRGLGVSVVSAICEYPG
ncbi:MAG: hypothetical protein ACRD4R_06570 [Candidatus Acidiferrales bacterium]